MKNGNCLFIYLLTCTDELCKIRPVLVTSAEMKDNFEGRARYYILMTMDFIYWITYTNEFCKIKPELATSAKKETNFRGGARYFILIYLILFFKMN